MKKKLCRKQAGGPVKLDAVDYLQSYMQSPEFKKRFAKYNYSPDEYEKQLATSKNARKKLKPFLITKEDPNDEIGSRVSNPTFNKIFSSKEQPIPADANVLLSVPQAKEIGADINNDILPHEYSHQARSLNDIETLYTAFRNKNPKAGDLYGEYQKHKFSSPKNKDLSFERYLKEKKKMDHHDFGPSENHADLDTLRWLMHKNGIYDTRKGNMTIEDLNKAKATPAINKSFNFKRLKKNFKDADIIWMNNNIASNVEDDSGLTTAKKGGTITTTGYLPDSPDRYNDFNIIPGNQITMKGVKKKIVGIDDLGNQQLMMPGGEYVFPGSYVTEIPVRQQGGPLNSQDRSHWNGYVDYLESKGYKGSKELDSRDTNLSKKLFDEFSKGQYSYDEFVPRVQTDISSYRQQAMEMIRSGKAEFKGDLNKLDEVFMPGLSNVDAWAGSRTTSWKFPNEKVPVTEVGTGRYVKDMNNMVYSKINKKQLGGAAYEMPWSKFNRPDVKIPYRLPSAPFEWGDPNAAAPEGLDKPINPMTAEQKFAQQVQQQQQVTEFAPDASVNPKGNKIKDFLNKITPGNMASGLIEEYANPYSLTNTTSNLAGVATYFDNKRKSKANDAYMRSQMSADNVFGVDNREDRGDYVNTGTSYGMFRPDQMGAKSPDGMYSGKFYNNMAEGGYIPEEISTPQMMGNTSTREMVGDMMVPEFATAPAIPVNAFNFPTREVNVNVNKNTKDAYAYYTKDKNLPAHIAAGIVGNLFQESGLKPGAVEKTNTANGRGIAQWDVRDRWQGLLSWASQQGRDPYDLKTQLDYVLVEPGESGKAMNKLKNSKTPEEAAIIFGKLYERPSEKHANWNMRTSVANKLYNNQFKEGGEYEMSADEIAELRKQGYDIEEL